MLNEWTHIPKSSSFYGFHLPFPHLWSHRLLWFCLAPLCKQLVHRQQLCLVNCRGCLLLSTVILEAVSPVPIGVYILLFLWLIVPLPAAPESPSKTGGLKLEGLQESLELFEWQNWPWVSGNFWWLGRNEVEGFLFCFCFFFWWTCRKYFY